MPDYRLDCRDGFAPEDWTDFEDSLRDTFNELMAGGSGFAAAGLFAEELNAAVSLWSTLPDEMPPEEIPHFVDVRDQIRRALQTLQTCLDDQPETDEPQRASAIANCHGSTFATFGRFLQRCWQGGFLDRGLQLLKDANGMTDDEMHAALEMGGNEF